MNVDKEETETEQLMRNEGEEEEVGKIPQIPTAVSPEISVKMSSSGAASQASRVPGQLFAGSGTNSGNETIKLNFVNERRPTREHLTRSTYNSRPRNIHKEAPDVKHMEKALLELLDDFHTGKLKAFGKGCSMEQMMDIRDQQEHLARLHFKLGAEPERMSQHEDQTSHSSIGRDKMSQLVQSLEQLSASIENLHSGDSFLNNT